jgi:inactive STAND
MSIPIFFIHTKDDLPHLEKLVTLFKPLENQGKVQLWDCNNYYKNADDISLFKQIEKTQVAIILISNAYLNYWEDEGLMLLHQRAFGLLKEGKIQIVPLVVENCFHQDDPDFLGREIPVFFKNDDPDYFKYATIIRQVLQGIKPKVSFAAPLSTGLLELNYKDQRDILKNHKAKNDNKFDILNIFLIRGTKECGHQLLMKSFLKSNGIKIQDEQKQLIKLNAREFNDFENVDWMWHTIAQKVNNANPPANNARAIATYLFDRLQREHIFITLNDVDYVKKDTIKVVQKIWSEIHAQIQDFIKMTNKPMPFHIFLFLNDRSGLDEEYTKEHFRGDVDVATCERVFCILPKIKYLSSQDAKEWLEWIVDRNEELIDLRPHLKVTCLIPEEHSEISMKKAIANVFDALSTLDDTLVTHKNKYLNEWFPEF